MRDPKSPRHTSTDPAGFLRRRRGDPPGLAVGLLGGEPLGEAGGSGVLVTPGGDSVKAVVGVLEDDRVDDGHFRS